MSFPYHFNRWHAFSFCFLYWLRLLEITGLCFFYLFWEIQSFDNILFFLDFFPFMINFHFWNQCWWFVDGNANLFEWAFSLNLCFLHDSYCIFLNYARSLYIYLLESMYFKHFDPHFLDLLRFSNCWNYTFYLRLIYQPYAFLCRKSFQDF